MILNEYERNAELENSFIRGWYIDSKLCDEFIKEFKNICSTTKPVKRNNPKNYSLYDLLEFQPSTYENYFKHLNVCFNNYKKHYNFIKEVGKIKLVNEINVQYYTPKNYYNVFHCEISNRSDQVYRNLVFTTYLNNVCDRGETEFFYQKTKIKPKKGLTIFWPANWTHTHKGCETSEEKYIVTGWFEIELHQPDIYINLEEYSKDNLKLTY